MASQSKKNKRNLEKVPEKSSPVAEAVAALKQFEDAKFDETVEIAINLAVFCMKLSLFGKCSNTIVFLNVLRIEHSMAENTPTPRETLF